MSICAPSLMCLSVSHLYTLFNPLFFTITKPQQRCSAACGYKKKTERGGKEICVSLTHRCVGLMLMVSKMLVYGSTVEVLSALWSRMLFNRCSLLYLALAVFLFFRLAYLISGELCLHSRQQAKNTLHISPCFSIKQKSSTSTA